MPLYYMKGLLFQHDKPHHLSFVGELYLNLIKLYKSSILLNNMNVMYHIIHQSHILSEV